MPMYSFDTFHCGISDKDTVIVRKVDPVDAAYHQGVSASLQSEWLSKEDSDAYDDL